jgi:hypothetical protein
MRENHDVAGIIFCMSISMSPRVIYAAKKVWSRDFTYGTWMCLVQYGFSGTAHVQFAERLHFFAQ